MVTTNGHREARVRAAVESCFSPFDGLNGGYTGVTLTPQTWSADSYQVEDMRESESRIRVINTVVTEVGEPGAQS